MKVVLVFMLFFCVPPAFAMKWKNAKRSSNVIDTRSCYDFKRPEPRILVDNSNLLAICDLNKTWIFDRAQKTLQVLPTNRSHSAGDQVSLFTYCSQSLKRFIKELAGMTDEVRCEDLVRAASIGKVPEGHQPNAEYYRCILNHLVEVSFVQDTIVYKQGDMRVWSNLQSYLLKK